MLCKMVAPLNDGSMSSSHDEETLDVRESLIRSFDVRIPPSGRKCFFLHRQIGGRRVRQSTGIRSQE